MKKNSGPLLEHREITKVLLEEVRVQRGYYQEKADSMNARASHLISAASITSVIGISNSASLALRLPAIVLFIVAAIFGILALRPKHGDEVSVDYVADLYETQEIDTAAKMHWQTVLSVLKSDEKSLEILARHVQLGYVFLVGAMVLLFASVLVEYGVLRG